MPKYELIDKDGNMVAEASAAKELGQEAKRRWPNQQSDEDRTGIGWHIRIVGFGD